MLTLAREGASPDDITTVDIRELVEDCWNTVDTRAATLINEIDGDVDADEGRLRQLFENLIRNAVEHGGEDVTVRIGAMPDGFYVEDDGPGIPEQDRSHVFDAGFSTANDGTRFGLSIVNRVVEAHGWEIRVTDGEAGGARFEITGVDVDSDDGDAAH
uniref:sensor histidine kinase n=1 Tax=Salinarchaeum laminariae TaxID=869888 RepID=UPI0035C1596C